MPVSTLVGEAKRLGLDVQSLADEQLEKLVGELAKLPRCAQDKIDELLR